MKIRKLLRLPLESADELERAALWVAERRDRLLVRLRAWSAVAGILVLVNLTTTGFRSGADPPERFFSLFFILGVATVWTPGVVRRLWAYPRLLAAQRCLLRHRGLIADEGPDALGEEIERLVARIRKRLATLEQDDGLLTCAERRAYVLLGELAECVDGVTTGLRERRRIEQLRLRSRLEAFRVALAGMEAEELLRPDFYSGGGYREALADADGLLEDGS